MSADEEMNRVAAGYSTVSDKIRALAAAGHERADIARFLGKRYQHVRNVLTEDERLGRPMAAGKPAVSTRGAGVQEAPTAWREPALLGEGLFRLAFDQNGMVSLPQQVEQALGLHRGGVVIAELQGDRLVLLSTAESLRRAQALVRALVPGDDSLADSLIEDRRREVAKDSDG
ncbi:MAG: AbrB/MazE/SpoVT family DNA-binding domain-containing protein [Proteobacteria bacterium]|nr:AbrB/MazE/SpoVT family DNA-binding domain-containing protein [Pseudomonadota bacterium]